MPEAKQDLMTGAQIAKQLGVSAAKVKKAIDELGLAPDAKKGPCAYYSARWAAKIKSALK